MLAEQASWVEGRGGEPGLAMWREVDRGTPFSLSTPRGTCPRSPDGGWQLTVSVRIQSLFVLDCWKMPTEPPAAAQSAFPGCGLDDIFPNLFNKHRVRTILFG